MSLSEKALAMQAGMMIGSAAAATPTPLKEPTFTEQEKFLQQLGTEFNEHLEASISKAMGLLGVDVEGSFIITPQMMEDFDLITQAQEPQITQQGLTEVLTHMYALRRKSDGVFCAWRITVEQGVNAQGERAIEQVVITTSKMDVIQPKPTPEAPHALA